MHEAMSPDSAFLRFFSASLLAPGRESTRICREPEPGHATLLALSGDEVVGCASYERVGEKKAEVAFAVADRMHHMGVATLLLEHLVSQARDDGIEAFIAEVLAENTAMLRVFAGAGLPVRRRFDDGVIEVTIPLPRDGADTALDAYLTAVARREGSADAASLQHLFAPRSVAVIGAGRRPGTVGRAILDNIRTGGYQGRLYAVNPHAGHLGGVRCVPSVAGLPEAPDLAVIAVPPAAVPGIAQDCGTLGVKALAVITAGLDAGASADLLAICRRYGMRLVGPGSFGIAVPGARLDATFAASHPGPGIAGLVMQSGGLGLAMAGQLTRLGIGISSFASVGSKLDVSSNDLLLWWEHDGITRLAILYIESFGNPRKFARTARRVAETMPVLTVHAGRSATSQHAMADPGAAATPLASQQALFEQAGIIATPGLGELTEVTALLATQPVPRGRTVAIVSNVSGAAALAASACTGLGLAVHQAHGTTRSRLHALAPQGAVVTGPVDLTATVSSSAFRRCLELLAADEDVDAIIALLLPTAATGDLTAAIQQADVPLPLTAVVLSQAESVRLLDGANGKRVPAYGCPEAAAGALARAAAYGDWLAEPKGEIPAFTDVAAGPARVLVHRFLAAVPGGGWLPPGEATTLLACYGIAPAEAGQADGPMAAKGDVKDGTEVFIGVTDDHLFGPLIVFGLGGLAAGVLADRAARLAPLTTTDADKLINSVSTAPLVRGYRGTPAADFPPPAKEALRGLLLRVSQLAEDLPEVTELSLGPVIARPDGAFVAGARIKAVPCAPQDPLLRRLR
jgi:acyl-CoA synthetase (NDP forming)/RimJ/RimL family protein N-acetyltransferase